MTDNKPWYASQTVWGGILAILSGLGGAIYSYQQHDMGGVIAALVAAAGGFHAVVGRFKATGTIGKALSTTDAAIQSVAAIVPPPPAS